MCKTTPTPTPSKMWVGRRGSRLIFSNGKTFKKEEKATTTKVRGPPILI